MLNKTSYRKKKEQEKILSTFINIVKGLVTSDLRRLDDIIAVLTANGRPAEEKDEYAPARTVPSTFSNVIQAFSFLRQYALPLDEGH